MNPQLHRIDVGPLFAEDAAGRAQIVEHVRAACHSAGFFTAYSDRPRALAQTPACPRCVAVVATGL